VSTLAKMAKDYGLMGLSLKREPSSGKRKRRAPESLLHSIVGLLSIYLGLEAAYLFLCEVRVLQAEVVSQLDRSTATIEERVQEHLSFLRYQSNRIKEMASIEAKIEAEKQLQAFIALHQSSFDIEHLQRFVKEATTLPTKLQDAKERRDIIGHKFENDSLLLQAFTHSSLTLKLG